MTHRLAAGLLVVVVGATGTGAGARELYRGDQVQLDFSGSLRGFGIWTRGTNAEDFSQTLTLEATRSAIVTPPGEPIECASAAVFADCVAFDLAGEENVGVGSTRLRGQLDLRVSDWLSARVAYDHRLAFGTLQTFEAQVGENLEPENLMANDWVIVDETHFEWDHRLYRAYLRAETEHFEATVGRQRIAWGVGRLWNPIDRLNAVEPLSIQPDELVGVDSVDLKWRFTGFTYLEAVYAPGSSSDFSSYALRLHGVLLDADYSLLLGSFERAVTVGVDFTRNVWDAAVRAEVVYTNPSYDVWRVGDPAPGELGDYWQIVVGADYLIPLGTGLYALVEHLYNGNALGFGAGRAGPRLNFFESTRTPPDPLLPVESGPYVRVADRDIFGSSRVVSGALHQTGIQLSYDITPALRGDLATLYDWNGSSAAFFPALHYTGFSDVEVTLGGQAFVGPSRSEFGSAEPVVFVLVDYFF